MYRFCVGYILWGIDQAGTNKSGLCHSTGGSSSQRGPGIRALFGGCSLCKRGLQVNHKTLVILICLTKKQKYTKCEFSIIIVCNVFTTILLCSLAFWVPGVVMVVCVLLEMTVPHVNTLPETTEENDAYKVQLSIMGCNSCTSRFRSEPCVIQNCIISCCTPPDTCKWDTLYMLCSGVQGSLDNPGCLALCRLSSSPLLPSSNYGAIRR